MTTIHFKPQTDLTFKSVIAVRTQLYQTLMVDSNSRLSLDLSEVKRCDSAGMALLIEVRKMCKQNNKGLEIIGMSTDTQALAEFCGVKDILIM